MSKIAFFSIPAHGHTNPTLEVVRMLTKLGHTVRYYSYTPFKSKIEDAGAEFFSCDQYDLQMKLSEKDSVRLIKDPAFSVKVLVQTTLALEEPVTADLMAFKPNCIVADSMAIWGKLFAKKLGIPYICSTTTFLFNKEASKIMPQNIGSLFSLLKALPSINRSLKKLQKRGYAVKNIMSIIAFDSNEKTICYTSPEFQPAAETFPETVTFSGPTFKTPKMPRRRSVKKTVYISLGTVNNRLVDFYKSCIKAFTGTDYKVIISVGKDTDLKLLGDIPENISIYPSVNQLEVLSVSDAFITHCGMNSASEGIYMKVPLVLFPQTTEQMGVAGRAYDLGCGEYLKNISPAEIFAKAKLVSENAKYKQATEKISASFKKAGGAEVACNAILDSCRR